MIIIVLYIWEINTKQCIHKLTYSIVNHMPITVYYIDLFPLCIEFISFTNDFCMCEVDRSMSKRLPKGGEQNK